MKHESPNLTATITHKEGRSYILTFSDGQELKIPIFQLPKQVRIGETIHLHLLTSQQAQQEKTELARTLLEEILNGQ
jgi:hypothetical protein